MLTLGWSDGNTFLPINSVLLSSENKQNRLAEAAPMDKRTVAYKRRALSVQKGTQVMLELLKIAKAAAIPVSCVLFDSWFTSPSAIHSIKEIGYDVIGMVKRHPRCSFVIRERTSRSSQSTGKTRNGADVPAICFLSR